MGFSHRYDIRNRLEDKGQFGLKPILPRRRRREEEELEEELDRERYLGLGVDILEHELLEGVPTIPQFLLMFCVCVCFRGVEKEGERAHGRVPGCGVCLQGERCCFGFRGDRL